MTPEETDIDTSLRGNDPGRWGHSMANMAELILPILDAAECASVAEVGAYAGDFTEVLVDWAEGAGAKVIAIDPLPQQRLEALSERRPALELLRATSAEALSDMPRPDAVIIDGDHNYHTVSEELSWIGERSEGADTPLLLLHDVCWPHGRRDAYYAPDRVPPEYQDNMGEGVGVFPGEPGVTVGGLPYKWAAKHEGGPRNGVLTAMEDFLEGRPGMRMAIVPIFFGLAVAWHEDAPWAGKVSDLLEPWDRDPIMARLEGNRVFHLALQHRARTETHMAQARIQSHAEKDAILRDVLSSRTFALADRISALRGRKTPSWREHIERALNGPSPEEFESEVDQLLRNDR